MKKKTVAIFVMGYRALEYLKQGTVQSVVDASNVVTNYHLVHLYLDNYSVDGSLQYLVENYKSFDILMSSQNVFYCEGINAGLRYLYKRYKPDYYILLDADQRVDENTFQVLLEYAESHPQIGIVQPVVRDIDNPEILYSCGHKYDRNHHCQPMQQLPSDAEELENLPSCSIVSTLYRSEIFTQCGILNPIFRIYYESSDISFRARKFGWKCACYPKAIAYHLGTDKYNNPYRFHAPYYVTRNRMIFWYFHDLKCFQEVREAYQQKYQELQVLFEASEYGLLPAQESVRRGLKDALDMTQDETLRLCPQERIEYFDKTVCMLIQNGIHS